MRSIAALVVLALAASSPSIARADDAEEVRVLVEQAQRHFDLGEYVEAIASYREAYRIDPRPGLLYNLGQAYRLSGDCVTAALMYRNFLRLAPDSKYRPLAEEQLASMEACEQEQIAAGKSAVEPDPEAVDAPEPEPETPEAEPEPEPLPPAPPPPPRRERNRTARIVGLATAAAGAVMVAVGGYFSFDAMRASRDVSDAYREGGAWAELDAIDARGRRSEIAGAALLSTGVVALAAGAVVTWRF